MSYLWCFSINRPYGVHPISAGQFPVRWGAGGAQCGAPLHRLGIPKPHHPMAKGWPPITCRLPLDAAHNRPHHIRPEAWGQRQLHLWGHKQLWLQRGGRSPQCHRWVTDWREYSRAITESLDHLAHYKASLIAFTLPPKEWDGHK